jgi:hypothetical protein
MIWIKIKKTGLILLAGGISFILFGIVLIGLSALAELFKEEQMLEPQLVAEAFLKTVGFIFVGSWLWLLGKFLSKEKTKSWGLKVLYIYFAVTIISYLFSFFITDDNRTQQQSSKNLYSEESTTPLSVLEQSGLKPAIAEQLDLSFTENEWSFTEIRGVGKNLVSMASFYNVCAHNGIIEKNLEAIRFASFSGMKYLIVAGIGTTEIEKKWSEQGANGFLVHDPETSEETVKVEFNQETCDYVKNILDANYSVLETYLNK